MVFIFENRKVSIPQKKDISDSKQSKNPFNIGSHPASIIQRAKHSDVKQLQKTIGNQAVCQLMKEIRLTNGNFKPVKQEPSYEEKFKHHENDIDLLSKPIQKKENKTGLPDNLKASVENLSSLSMDDVRVHYNSSKPEEVGALAYTQGADIHVAPGQQKYLSHEAWHVVQQKQGRVKPTIQMNSFQINDDAGLEREANLNYEKAAFAGTINTRERLIQRFLNPLSSKVIQGQWATIKKDGKRLNLKKTNDPNILILTRDGSRYNVVERTKDEIFVEKIEEEVVHKKYRYNRFHPYLSWTNKSTGVKVEAPFGGKVISATHKRGAPKIGSKAKDFGGESLGDSYEEYIRGLRSNGKSDKEIAETLLTLNNESLTKLEKRAIDMLHITVYLAEEWRKQGAGKLYRGFLRLVSNGETTFDEFKEYFKFIISAKEGRKEVGRIRNVEKGLGLSKEDLPQEEQELIEELSDMEDGDLSSDDEMSSKKKMKTKRIFYKNSDKP